jgi:PAS domain S-box-containing protein
VLNRDDPVTLPAVWEAGTTTPLAQALSLQSLDPLGGMGVYVDDELALLVITAFAPESLPGEREDDFLLTLSASFSQNITSRRLFEDITAERERLQAILASTTDAVVLTSRRAKVVVFNATAEAFFGVSEDEASGRPFSEVLAQDAFEEMAERMLAGTIEEIEGTDIVLSDGRVLLTRVGPVRAADGEIAGYVIDMADVTEIQTLSEQKSQVLRMASHDLLNPLGQAMGAFELLIEDIEPLGLGALDQELVDNVRMGHERMSSLLRDLLDLERLEAGTLLKRQIISANRVLEEVVAEMEPLASSRRQTFSVNIPDGLPDIDVDTVQMHRALCNLVDNAFKYTPSGGRIALRAESIGDRVRIAIQDDGIGIPEEAMERLFERFYRVRQPGTEDVLGTGLGLSLVKSVIELHEGTVEVDSTPGEGSTFVITLPIADQPAS